MKRKIIAFSASFLVLCLMVVLMSNYNNFSSKTIVVSDNEDVINTDGMLTMMYEVTTGSGDYEQSSDTTWPTDGYVFNAEMSRCENGSTLSWNDETKSVMIEANVSDKCYVYFDKKNLVNNFAEYITTQVYTGIDGENGLYYHDADLVNGAQDNSYRYSGANPNNYVCFGATGAECQNEDNQYRIIGVFNNQVKLIKATSIGDYMWDADNVNTWEETTKPDIYTTLNTTYYNTIPAEWQNLIASTTWQVGGMALSQTNTAKQYYDVEVGTGQSGYEEIMKIGLMYVSDYGYCASPENWATALYEDNYGTDNWLYLGDYEWLLSRFTDSAIRACIVNSDRGGDVYADIVRNANAVRPSFSLASTVELSSGTGTSTDPFVLDLG